MLRRTILHLGAGLLSLILAFPASAQPYPQRLIHLINPYAAGGSLDTLARIIALHLTANLGESVIVENRVGAGGNIGSAFVAKSAPDGYTLVMGSSATHGIN